MHSIKEYKVVCKLLGIITNTTLIVWLLGSHGGDSVIIVHVALHKNTRGDIYSVESNGMFYSIVTIRLHFKYIPSNNVLSLDIHVYVNYFHQGKSYFPGIIPVYLSLFPRSLVTTF
jgi:hypothetical protein